MFEEKKIIYHRIPKTASQSMRKIIMLNVPNQLVCDLGGESKKGLKIFNNISADKRNNFQWYIGNFPLNFYKYLDYPSVHFTLIRNPENRIISLYKFIKSNKKHPHHSNVKNWSMIEFINNYPSHQIENYFVRRFLPTNMAIKNNEKITTDHMKSAIKTIHERFVIVGIVEHFDRTLQLCRHIFGFTNTENIRLNVSHGNVDNEMYLDAMEYFKEKNLLDIEFYRRVTNIFFKQCLQYNIK